MDVIYCQSRDELKVFNDSDSDTKSRPRLRRLHKCSSVTGTQVLWRSGRCTRFLPRSLPYLNGPTRVKGRKIELTCCAADIPIFLPIRQTAILFIRNEFSTCMRTPAPSGQGVPSRPKSPEGNNNHATQPVQLLLSLPCCGLSDLAQVAQP